MKRTDVRQLAAAHGWLYVRCKSGHEVWRCPYGCCQTSLATSAGDWRAVRNAGALFRRCPGAQLETEHRDQAVGEYRRPA